MNLKPGDVLWAVCPTGRGGLYSACSARVKSVSDGRVVFEERTPATGFGTTFQASESLDLWPTREKAILAHVGRMRAEAIAAQERLATAERLLAAEQGK